MSNVLKGYVFNRLCYSMISWQSLLKEQSLSSLAIDQLRILFRYGNALNRSFFFEGINKDKGYNLTLILLLALHLFQSLLITLLFYLADFEWINLDPSINAPCYYELSPYSQGSHLSIMYFQCLHAAECLNVPSIDVAIYTTAYHIIASLLKTHDWCFRKLAEHASCYLQFLTIFDGLHEPNTVSAGSNVHVFVYDNAT